MTQYLYGNLSQPFQVTASRAPDNTLTVYYYDDYGALYALERGGQRYYVASDHLGTPKVITDNTGVIVRQMEYDSWGVKVGDTNDAFDLPVGFAGGIPEDATGLVRFGFRDYEPGTGRWAAKDPKFHAGGLNLYVYIGNDPVNYIDPTGLSRATRVTLGIISAGLNTAALITITMPVASGVIRVASAAVSLAVILDAAYDYGKGELTGAGFLQAAGLELLGQAAIAGGQTVDILINAVLRALGIAGTIQDATCAVNRKK